MSSVESQQISNLTTNSSLSSNSQSDPDYSSLNKINQPTPFTSTTIPSSNYNISQQANQYLPLNKPQTQPYTSNINQQNFMMQQQQTNMNYSRNNQMNPNQGYIDNFQQQKQMQNNRMGMQTTVNANNNMFSMNNNGGFINNQQRLPINQQHMSLQTHSNPIFNQFDQQNQHNISFNPSNNLNQYHNTTHSFHQQHANININQTVFPQSQSANVMNQPQMQLQASNALISKFFSYSNIIKFLITFFVI